MANDDAIAARGGVLPVDFPNGNFKRTLYRLTTGAAAANVFIGSLVDLDANGRASFAFNWAASSNTVIGPVVGFVDTSYAALPTAMETTTAGPYLPGNTDAYVFVCDDPMQDFVIQEDTGGSALAETNIGNNATPIFRSSSGNTTTGYSTLELDRSSAGTGTGGTMMIKGIHRHINSDGTQNAAGNYCKWIVRLVSHRWLPMSTGPGGTQI